VGVSAELEPGDTLGAYRLETLIGEGAVGLVFRARREADGCEVALKVLKRELTGDFVFQHRFRQEARAAAEVREPHLVAIVDADTVDGRSYLAVEYVGGGSLAERIASDRVLPIADVLRVVSDVAAGLDALHAAEIVHRDIKPSNILFDTDGRAMLTDFGLAKGRTYTVLTRPGEVLGTLHYLAPELIRGEPATPRSDVYGLGCVIFECVSGRTPFADKGVFQVGLAHLIDEPPDPGAERPDLPGGFSTAILTALEKEPERRPQSAGAYAALLAAAGVEAASV
jgi:serine/threonine-protein kinase